MRDEAIAVASRGVTALDRTNIMREYAQTRILHALQRGRAMPALAFHGGTALRFLHRLPRYSEDLDFALERPEAGYDFLPTIDRVGSDLEAEGYDIKVRANDRKTVNSALFGFVGLPFAVGASPHRDQVLWVKLEVDTNPPAGARLQTTTITGFTVLRLQHHDLPSMFAGKVAAVLTRTYTKGRDLFDLMWYAGLPEHLEPNATLLRNAVTQSEPGFEAERLEAWRDAVLDRLRRVEWTGVRQDVARFLVHASDADLLTLDTFEGLLG